MSVATGNQSNDMCHVAVLPFPISSHPMAMLNLALKLALEAPHVRFSFFNTTDSNASLFRHPKYRSLPANFKAYDVHDGVPAGHIVSGHHLKAVWERVDHFLRGTPECYKTVVDLAVSETGAKVTCLLSDALVTSAREFARDYLNGVPWIVLWTPFPCLLSTILHGDRIPDRSHGQDASLDFIPGLAGMRTKDLDNDIDPKYGGEEKIYLREVSQTNLLRIRDSTALLLSFYDTLNPEGLNQDFKSKFQQVLNLGFLTLWEFSDETDTPEDCAIMRWLDEQKERSVVYVAFGTLTALPTCEMIALAEALEESGIPFLWSLKDHFKMELLDEFENKTLGQGKIVSWVPQKKVLQHKSVGVFVTHSGSNSVYESITGEVPLICRPFFGDQPLLARMVEKVWEIGITIKGKMFTKNEVLKSLKVILEQEDGRLMRERARRLKETAFEAASPNGSATKDLETLVGLISSTHKVI